MIKIELVETFSSDEFQIYGLWRIRSGIDVYEVGCVIGVPDHMIETARSACSITGMLDAWYADSSDWSDAIERDEALDILSEKAVKLWEQFH